MRALKPRMKRLGFVAALLAGVVLAGVDEAAARGMSNHNVGIGNGRPPALHNNTNHPIVSNPGSGTSKPGKHSGKPDKTSSRDRDRGKDRKAEREREREERKAERKGSCITRGGCRVDVGKPSPGQPAPTVEVRDHGTSQPAPTVEVRDHGASPTGASVNSTTRTLTTVNGLIANGARDHRGKPSRLTPSDLRKLENINATANGFLGLH
jgi:hypothetical protein